MPVTAQDISSGCPFARAMRSESFLMPSEGLTTMNMGFSAANPIAVSHAAAGLADWALLLAATRRWTGPAYKACIHRSTDAPHSQLQWSARGGGRRASRFALPRRASHLNPATRRMGEEESQGTPYPISRMI